MGNTTQNALEEARTLLEQSDRARRITEQELSDTNEQLSELTCQNQAIAGAKRKLESEMQTLGFWTRCPVRLLTLRRRPRRQWLMLLVLLRNSVLNKTWLLDSKGNANS